MIPRYLATMLMLGAIFVFGGLRQSHAQSDMGLSVVGHSSASQVFSLADLQRLPVTEFETSTIWTKGVHRFTGVSLADLLAAADIEGDTLKAIAANDYSVEIPTSDAVSGGPIVAYFLDGQPMSLRNKGPFWIVYPYDRSADYRSETIYTRSIWQLVQIRVLP